MLKLMIVDDEPLLRMAIKGLIKWEEHGYALVEDAPNGSDAMNIIEREQPDIVLTDIKMPVMNGVELIKCIEEKYPKIKTVVLSNYDDFTYVKEALLHGAVDYVLKSNINAENLISVINGVREKFLKREPKAGSDGRKENEIDKNILWLKNEYLKKLVLGQIASVDEIQSSNSFYNTGIREGRYLLLGLKIDNRKMVTQKYAENERPLLQNIITGALKELFSFEGTYFFTEFDSCVLLVYMNGTSESAFSSSVLEFASRLQFAIKRCLNLSVTMGVSELQSGIDRIPAAYRQCMQAIEERFYLGYGKVIHFGGLQNREDNVGAKFIHKENIKVVRESVNKGDIQSICGLFSQMVQHIRNKHYNPDLVRQFTVDFILLFKSAVIDLTFGEGDFEDENRNIYHTIYQCETVDEMDQFVSAFISKTMEARPKGGGRAYSPMVRQSIEYIKENYPKDITLSSISVHVAANPSYLSRLFLQDTGMNFIDYLTDYRITRSKKLLKETLLGIPEIGIQVGYPNPKYFCQVFKKVTGVSPLAYRNNK